MTERRPRRRTVMVVAAIVAALAAIVVIDGDLGFLFDAEERARAFERFGRFFAAFGAPNTTPDVLRRGLHLTLQTLAIGVLGTLLGAAIGYVIALGASRAVVMGDGRGPRSSRAAHVLRRVVVEGSRLILDVLRGVPDFAWAILVLTIPGPGPVTGIVAIGLSIGGILGKIYSELWDAVEPRRYAALRTTGAGRRATFVYGIQPLAARAMLSYTLMRGECAVRNATVIGVVGGGGLGAEMFDELNYGRYDVVVTLLVLMLGLTASMDVASNLLRRALRADPDHPGTRRALDLAASLRRRGLALGGVALLLAFCWFYLRHPFILPAGQRTDAVATALRECGRVEWGWIGEQLAALLHPDLRPATLARAVTGAGLPLALAFVGTIGGVLIAVLLAYPGSIAFQVEAHRFTGESNSALVRALRWIHVVAARGAALVLRAVPEVAWIWMLATLFTIGPLPGAIAIALHSGGVLMRVFTETIDDVPFRRLEIASFGSRATTFLYGGIPACANAWSTYTFFQFEHNVRAGLVLGIIGVGGLGDDFHTSFSHWNLAGASTSLIAMVVLTIAIDRVARSMRIGRVGT